MISFWGVEHIDTGNLLFERKSRRGYTWWEPELPFSQQYIGFIDQPRFFRTLIGAEVFIKSWAKGPLVSVGDDINTPLRVVPLSRFTNRKAESLRPIKLEVIRI